MKKSFYLPFCLLFPAFSVCEAARYANDTTYPLAWDEAAIRGRGVKAPIQLPDSTILSVNSIYFQPPGVHIYCFRSTDLGSTFSVAGKVASDFRDHIDLGDAALLRLRSGEILCSYRQNRLGKKLPPEQHEYSIRVAISRDSGATWQPHSIVDITTGSRAGLWASFLFETQSGDLQCYYDDEAAPARAGFHRHQWLTMRTWNAATEEWGERITVSRAHNREHLSRDGMCSVVETSPDHLLCVFESVDTAPPHKGVLRSVKTSDGGATWSWKSAERPIVWRPANHTYNALAPWMIPLSSGPLMCVFVTDEDRPTPDTPSTGKLNEDVKAIYSYDSGITWSPRPQFVARHPAYLPGAVELRHRKPRNRATSATVLLQYYDYRTARAKHAYPQ